jgi:thiol-disulfide isomerase/thioredoxin
MRTPLLKTSYLLALALMLGIATHGAESLKVGDNFPELNGFELEGKLPESLKGKVVLVDFWASWCAPCRESFPALEDLHKRLAAKGVVVIGVSVDEVRGEMERFLKKNPVTFTVLRDAKQRLVARAGVPTMPTSLLVDRTGRVRFIHAGYQGKETKLLLERELTTLLEATP